VRIIIYLGKGGTGKTTVAAATALRSAELGHSTLVASTDIAHSLADSLDRPLGSIPVNVAPNLWAQEISVVADIQNYWGTLQEYVSGIIRDKGVNSVVADELSTFPGMDELVCLLHIDREAREQQFERVIIDAAPTGESIRLLTMPDTFLWYAGHVKRSDNRLIKMMMKPLTNQLLQGSSELLSALEKLDKATAELRKTLSNPEISSYRVVLQPEKMVIREAERAISYLGLFDYPVDGVVVNRVLPEATDEGEFFARRRQLQQVYLDTIENSFRPLPLWYVPYYADEIFGLEALSRLARDCFGDQDPGSVFYRGVLQEVIDLENGSYLMRIPLPFVSGSNVRLRQRGDEMFVTIGNFKREMILPTALAKRKATGGQMKDGVLEIKFDPRSPSTEEASPG
jgi:arsenite-transporting ATPase